VNDRRVLNGIFWVLRSGAPWRDLPGSFGYTTCYNRFVLLGAIVSPPDVVAPLAIIRRLSIPRRLIVVLDRGDGEAVKDQRGSVIGEAFPWCAAGRYRGVHE
jgi:transposase